MILEKHNLLQQKISYSQINDSCSLTVVSQENYLLINKKMRIPFKKSIKQIPIEKAHGWAGNRQVLLSKSDPISNYFEAMTKWYLKAGTKFDWHHHDKIDEFFWVLKGKGVIEFKDNKKMKYQEDDLIYIPSNLEHRIIASDTIDNEFFFVRLQS